MIKTILIIALALACSVLLAICLWLVENNWRLKERLYDAEDALELAPIPWGQGPNLRSWGEEGDHE